MWKSITNTLAKVNSKIDQVLFKPKSLANLGFFRICIGLFCLLQVILVYPDLLNIYGEYGYTTREISEVIIPDFQPRISWFTDFVFQNFGVTEDHSLYWLTHIYMAMLLLLMAGFATRFMAIACFGIFSMYFGTGNYVIFGADCFALLSLFYCVIMPVGRVFSIDNLILKREPKPSMYGSFYTRLLQFHLCIVYLFAGLSKAVGVAWWNGEGIWRSLMSDHFRQFDMSWMADYPVVPMVLSISVVVIETLYFALIFFKKTRPLTLFAIVSMHVGIAIFMGLHLFAFILIFWNLTAFGWPYVESFSKTLKAKFTRAPVLELS